MKRINSSNLANINKILKESDIRWSFSSKIYECNNMIKIMSILKKYYEDPKMRLKMNYSG